MFYLAKNLRALALYYGLFGLRDSASRRLLGGPWDGLTPADLDYYLACYLADPADADRMRKVIIEAAFHASAVSAANAPASSSPVTKTRL